MASGGTIQRPKNSNRGASGNLDLHGCALAFAALGKPGAKALGEALRAKPKPGFDFAVAEGQGIVKIGGISEIAHAELIQPFEGAEAFLAANQRLDAEFLGVHGSIVTPLPFSERD